MGVGMPATLYLNEFGSRVWDAFGDLPYHVGSSLTKKRGWRDVDVRLILDDETYAKMELGDPEDPHRNAKWVALTMAFSELGKAMTGLPIDFQIQQQTFANRFYKGPRSALGIVPWRIEKTEKKPCPASSTDAPTPASDPSTPSSTSPEAPLRSGSGSTSASPTTPASSERSRPPARRRASSGSPRPSRKR